MRLERNFEMWFDKKLLRAYFIHEKNSNHFYKNLPRSCTCSWFQQCAILLAQMQRN